MKDPIKIILIILYTISLSIFILFLIIDYFNIHINSQLSYFENNENLPFYVDTIETDSTNDLGVMITSIPGIILSSIGLLTIIIKNRLGKNFYKLINIIITILVLILLIYPLLILAIEFNNYINNYRT